MAEADLQRRYHELTSAVRERGERFRKAHGEWIRLRLDEMPDGLFLQLDTWNRQLICKHGSGDYNYHVGFEPFGGSGEVLGIDFGGFALYVTEARLATYERLLAALLSPKEK